MTKQRGSNLSFLFLALVILVCFSWVWQMDNKAPQLNYSEIRQQFEQENVEEVSFPDEHTLVLTLRREVEGSQTIRYRIYDFQIFYEDMHELLEAQKAKGILTYDYPSAPARDWLEILLPVILTALLLGFMLYFFAPSPTRTRKSPLTTWPGPMRKKRNCRRSWSF